MKRLFLILISLFSTTLLLTSKVNAQTLPACDPTTDPVNIISSPDTTAKFSINVNNTSQQSNSGWKMEFECGGHYETDAAVESDNKTISTTLRNSGGPDHCEFEPGDHQITVKINVGGTNVDYCSGTYRVLNSDLQCKLAINPSTGIVSNTKLTVSGTDLTPGGRFVLFLDEDAIDIPNNGAGKALLDLPSAGNVNTPNFSNYIIPTSYMTPGPHILSLRTRNGRRDWFNPITSEPDFFSTAVCTLPFTIGTPDKPGEAGSSATGSAIRSCKPGDRNCTSSRAESCKDDKEGISTAIGCIHTQPALFIKDGLKFIIGIAGGIAFLLMIIGAFGMVTSAGNPDSLAASRDRFVKAIEGLLFILFAILLLKIIGVDLLGFGQFLGVGGP